MCLYGGVVCGYVWVLGLCDVGMKGVLRVLFCFLEFFIVCFF